MISCPEAVLENEKDFYQPVLSVMEAEIALNEGRTWNGLSSSDFQDILPGLFHFLSNYFALDVMLTSLAYILNFYYIDFELL